MKLSRILIKRFTSLLNIPDQAIRMVLATSDISGLERKTVPRELIPLNAIQISRGVLNYIVFQGLHNWVFPYAFVRQLNPSDPAFIPRAHLSVIMNVTHRNWTAIGNPESDTEPIVDPAGMVTFAPNSWSLEIWLRLGEKLVVPSHLRGVTQRLVDGDPVVETAFEADGITCRLTAFTEGRTTHCQVDVARDGSSGQSLDVIATVRPFNPEGASIVHTLSYESGSGTLQVNATDNLRFSRTPARIVLSTFDEGDVAQHLTPDSSGVQSRRVHCSVGLASGAVIFPMKEDENRSSIRISCRQHDNEGGPWPEPDLAGFHHRWEDYRNGAMQIVTPDGRLNELFRASLSTIIQFTDSASITPGPFTYHQFWFRDAAAMLLALDKAGCSRYASRVIRHFPEWQNRSGFFRSQQGEWDANGQALWSIWQHALLADDGRQTSELLFASMKRGVKWIAQARVRSGRKDRNVPVGLLPAGLSAEHLGLADYYYWDDFWSLAGIRAFGAVCKLLGRDDEASFARVLGDDFQDCLENAIRSSEEMVGSKAIPAGPQRGLDSGMIGSLCASYPLQIIPPADERMTGTLDVIVSRFFHDGMFFQDFVHSGLNTYLTLQIAHAYLYRGQREEFLKIFREVSSRATSTYAFPEAIHPKTGGGTMGDGHHGWSAAEMVLIIREMFVYEQWDAGYTDYRLVLLAGIPPEWFVPGSTFGVIDVPTPAGMLELRVDVGEEAVKMEITMNARDDQQPCLCDICFPFVIAGSTGVDRSNRDMHLSVEGTIVRTELYDGLSAIVVRPMPRRDETFSSVITEKDDLL